MSEWWTYALSDFLMFSPQVYYRLFELHNRALWPAQLLTVGLALAMLYLLLRRDGGWPGSVAAILGALWIWLAWAFFHERYATINWAAVYVAPFIAAQGGLLVWFGSAGNRLGLTSIGQRRKFAGLGLFAFALLCYPLLAPLMGRSWLSGEIFGVAPDPTALATLALLARSDGRGSRLAMIVPALWCLVSTLTLWTMGAADFFVPLAGALAAIGIASDCRRESKFHIVK
jgi:Family of unknown function (DUF6064)